MMHSEDDVVSMADAAKMLPVSRPFVEKLIDEGRLPLHHAVGEDRFVRANDVRDFEAQMRAKAKALLEAHTEDDDPALIIEIYDGEYSGDLSVLTDLCSVEGSARAYDRPPYSILEEAHKILDLCEKRYSAPLPQSSLLTVVIGRKGAGPLVRLDVYAKNGQASASVLSNTEPRWDTGAICYLPEDNVINIVRKLLAST